MIDIDDVLQELNGKDAIKKRYPGGISDLDLTFIAMRQTLLSGHVPWFGVAYIDEDIYKQVLQNQSTQKC